jgi:hypothetical protein
MFEFIAFANEYKDVAFDLLFALHAVALVVVNVTKTPADNEFLGKAYKALEWAAGIVSRKAKTPAPGA